MDMYERLYFAKYVRKMRVSLTPDHDFNRFPWQSRIVVQELFNCADNNTRVIKIFLGDVKTEFYKSMLFENIKALSEKGINFDIVLAEPPLGQYVDIWRNLIISCNNKVRVRYKKKYDEKSCHIILVGDNYRFELAHPRFEGEVTDSYPERPAQFGFHEKSTATEIANYWTQSIDKDLVEITAAA